MSEEGKKISFGFSKLSKKTSIIGTKKVNEIERVQFIDCVEEKSIKVKNEEKKEDKVLVIPLTINKVSENNSNVTKTYGGLDAINSAEKVLEIESKPEPIVVETLDYLAAKEILAEVNKSAIEEEQPKIFAVPLTTNAPLGEKQSSIEDYENIPVSEYGLAMLRGMGWCPGKGIGKNEKFATSSAPVLRPKGMGLGADKVIKTTPNPSTNNDNEELKLVKGAFVRIVAGSHKDLYGQVEGFDEESGRLFVKLSLKNTVISFNEFMVQLVSKQDFTKNCKVINVRKYEAYKDKEIENNKSDDHKNNNPRSSSPSQQKSSTSTKHKSNKMHGENSKRDKRSPDDSPSRQRRNRSREHSSTSGNKKSQRDKSSPDDSPPKQRSNASQSREYNLDSKNRKSYRDQSSSDDSLPRQRRNQSREQSTNFKSKKSFRNQSSSSDSSPRQKKYQTQSRENSTTSCKNRKSHRNRSSSSESPPRQRKNKSQSGERRSSSKSRNYSSNQDRRKRSRSRSPRRKY